LNKLDAVLEALTSNPSRIPKNFRTASWILFGAAPLVGSTPSSQHFKIKTASIALMIFSTRAATASD
jgi:hypothetical protein